MRRRLGSTDIPAVVALYRPEMARLAKMKNASDVYARLVHGVDLPKSNAMGRGLRVEPILRETYRRDVGPCTEAPGVIAHPCHEWATGSPDAYAESSAGGVVVEFKSASVWSERSWGAGGDAVPDAYALQCCWLMGVSNRPVAHLLVGFGVDGKDENGLPEFGITETRLFELWRDAELEAELLALGQRFFDEHVGPRRPPALLPVHNRRTWKQLQKGRAA